VIGGNDTAAGSLALLKSMWARRYNAFVPPSAKRPARHSIYKLEAGGILVIGVVIFLLTLARYWHHIAWGAR
jgi:hypothetical protein